MLPLLVACAPSEARLGWPPPGQAESAILGVVRGGQPELQALPADGLDGFVLRGALVDGDRAVARFYPRPLDDLGMSAGALAAPRAGELSQPVPQATRSYVATVEDGRLSGWIDGRLALDPLADVRLPCSSVHHDGGGGACVRTGTCSAGYYLALDGGCLESCPEDPTQLLDCDHFRAVGQTDDLGLSPRPLPLDVDGDGSRELVVTAGNRLSVFEVNRQFNVRLVTELGLADTVQAAYGLAAGDADNDGSVELFVGSWRDDLYQIAFADGLLAVERRLPRRGFGNWMVLVEDLDGDGQRELLISDRYEQFYALRWDGADYAVYYTSPMIGPRSDTTSKLGLIGLGDTDGDGQRELGTYNTIGMVDLWEADASGFTNVLHLTPRASAMDGTDAWRGALGDVDGDGKDELVYADEFGRVALVEHEDGAYRERWSVDVRLPLSTMVIGDVDPDPGKEIVAGSLRGRVLLINADTLRVEDVTPAEVESRWVSLHDFDGDGKQEIIVGFQSGFSRIYRHK